jgi:hypothetical protein
MDDFATSPEEGANETADQAVDYPILAVGFASLDGEIVGRTIDGTTDYDTAERSDEPPSVDSLW